MYQGLCVSKSIQAARNMTMWMCLFLSVHVCLIHQHNFTFKCADRQEIVCHQPPPPPQSYHFCDYIFLVLPLHAPIQQRKENYNLSSSFFVPALSFMKISAMISSPTILYLFFFYFSSHIYFACSTVQSGCPPYLASPNIPFFPLLPFSFFSLMFLHTRFPPPFQLV